MANVKYVSATRVFGKDATPAVDALDLDIKDGEFMVLVGPSGSGKTTALRLLAGLEPIDSGRVEIGDRDVTDVPPKDRDIAMVFQNYALYPHMTVEQNLAFGLQLRKTPKQEIARRVREAAKMLGLEPYLKRKPGALSGGQRQRVAMGRAIVREPQAFLMDEPLSNLDAKLRVSMRASLNQLHERLEAREHAQRRGLARARRPDQDHELAVLDVEVERVDSGGDALGVDAARAYVPDSGH